MEQDLIYFQDEAGNEVGLMMIDNFEHAGSNYALLATPDDAEEGGVYVMRMIEQDGELNFAMPDDKEMEALTPVIVERLDALSGGCGHDCCSCHGCHGEEEDDCCCGDEDDCCCGDGCHCGEE